ncbi:5-methylcytosine-specific restriction protein C [Rufibacter sp. DG15C]|uniref:McrC family protein n=1 Tax=Rufibacter sp. DG15C TaxID=1379909 RepID=UPI00078C908B|nr:restriction endonuclease [Rufibacter sp. DG15C]AMM51212.1 5-methylcytosine-specific restriction protein C [Rufibacter sp. DG15C]
MAVIPPITVFEYESLRLGKGRTPLTSSQLKALQIFYGEQGVPYYSLIHQGVKFNEYVGVIQVGDTTIEILPKADKKQGESPSTQELWRSMLLDMLKAVGMFEVSAPTSSSLNLKSNSILDLYFELFLKETEYLLHRGLIKKYRKVEGNTTALKGNLKFGKHLQQNLTHQERFYVQYTTYDVVHQWHSILYKTIKLLEQINTNSNLHSRIGALLLNFPEMPEANVTEATFNKLVYNRKTEPYRKAIEIARLLLLNYHPDVARGKNHVLALLFDMNLLWETFIFVTLKKHFYKNQPAFTATAQTTKYFWKPQKGNRSSMRADILIKRDGKSYAVLDTKWKNLNGYNPSPDDLRQLYVYNEYYTANKVGLVYPGEKSSSLNGWYLHPEEGNATNKECSVITLCTANSLKEWQSAIGQELTNWLLRPQTT